MINYDAKDRTLCKCGSVLQPTSEGLWCDYCLGVVEPRPADSAPRGVMPWRLTIAAMILAGYMQSNGFDFSKGFVNAALAASDALIKAHQESEGK